MGAMEHYLDCGILGEVECVVTYDYMPEQPGRYSGPPEDCYPDEPAEVDITDVILQGAALSPHRVSDLVHQLNANSDFKVKIVEHEIALSEEQSE